MKADTRKIERYNTRWTADSVRCINLPDPFLKETFLYVQEAGRFRTLPGYYTERAGLPSYLVLLTLAGHGKLSYDGVEYQIGRGQAFWIDCRRHHRYERAESGERTENGWEFLWVHFDGRGAEGYYHYAMRNGFRVFSLSEEERSAEEKILTTVLQKVQEKGPAAGILISELLTRMATVLMLSDFSEAKQMKGGTGGYLPDYVRTAREKIEKDYSLEMRLGELAAAGGVSACYLSREFRRCTGKTVMEYLLEVRLSQAKELLRFTDLSVREVAERCGMPNVSHFIESFRKREGATPHAYRKMWRENEK